MNKNSLLEVKNLKKYFEINLGWLSKEHKVVKAVNGISFFIRKGEIVGMVGESGCGKSTVGRTILQLYSPTEGKVIFEGKNIVGLQKDKMKKLRREMQIIFQDPFSSLNRGKKVGDIIGDPLKIHKIAHGKERKERVYELLRLVGLRRDDYDRFPYEFSGGQAQRIGIARALALNPKFIVADEPVSALDISIQAQILNLLQELQEKRQIAYLFITHDIAVVKYISQRILVMYLGEIVEQGYTSDIFNSPLHPYTQALLSAVPSCRRNRHKEEKIILRGEVPSSLNPPVGCGFYPRCWRRKQICEKVKPEEIDVGNGHIVKCHLYKEK